MKKSEIIEYIADKEILCQKNEEKFRRVCARWREGKITAVQAMAEVDLKPNTFYRKVKKMGL